MSNGFRLLFAAAIAAALFTPSAMTQNVPVVAVEGEGCPAPLVNTLNGNLFIQREDLSISGVGLSLEFDFAYNNHRSALNFGFGNGWTFTYNILYERRGANILIRNGDGRNDLFRWNGSGYTPPVGIFDVLEEYLPNRFRLTTKHQTVFNFDDPTHRRLTSVFDRNGNFINITYSSGLPVEFQDASGRSVRFLYAGGLLRQIVDNNTSPARAVGYSYDANDNMSSVRDPLGNTINYYYDANRNIIRIEDHRNNTFGFAYDADARVIQHSSALTLMEISYLNSPRRTTVAELVDGDLLQVSYFYDDQGRITRQSGDWPEGDVTYQYDADNNVIARSDALGNPTEFKFDDRGNVTAETDALGFTQSWSYDPVFNFVLSSTDASGNTTVHEYDDRGNLVFTEFPLGFGEEFTYNDRGQILSHTDGNGNTTVYDYDRHGYRSSITNEIGKEVFSHDAIGNLLAETDAEGNTTTMEYNAVGLLLRETDALEQTTTFAYDPNGNPTMNTDARGFTTSRDFDILDRPVAVLLPLSVDDFGGAGPVGSSYTYNAMGKILTSTDPNGNVTSYTYTPQCYLASVTDPLGNTTSYTYDANGNGLTVTDPNGNTTSYTYDALNRVSSVTNGAGETTSYSYDANGNVLTVTFHNGNTISYSYDAMNRLTSAVDLLGPIISLSYDNNSNVIASSDGNGFTTSFSYDALGRLIAETDPLGLTTSSSYDANGNLLSRTDRNGNTSSFTYNAVGELLTETDALGNTSSYSYDAVGNLQSIRDANGSTTSYSYDPLDRLLQEVYADATSRSYTYDPAGNTLSRTDNNGAVTAYSYDANNRLILRDYPGANDDAIAYDPGGRLISAANTLFNLTFAYDAADRLSSEAVNGITTSYGYNVAAGTNSISYPGGLTLQHDLDARGRIQTIRSGAIVAALYSYDAGDRVTSRSYPLNGTSTSYSYNANNWITSIVDNPGAFVNLGYTNDHEGNRLTEEKLHRPTNSLKFVYDAIYQLDRYQEGTLTGGVIAPILVDMNYQYDAVHNRTSTLRNGALTNYTSNNLNQYTQVAGISTVNPLYDANGNLVFDGVNSYGYDFENRLTLVNGGATAQYFYDPLGRRVQKNAGGATNFYLYAGESVIEEYDGGGIQQALYVYGNFEDETLIRLSGGNTYFYHHNALGSVVALTDGAGAVAERYGYTAFGDVSFFDGAYNPLPASVTGNPYLFSGRRLDSESGLFYYRARSYDPLWGRFLQRDPAGYVDALNLYAYVRNNPVNFTDPYGRIGVFVSGFSGSSGRSGSSGKTDMQKMAEKMDKDIPGGASEVGHSQQGKAVKKICKALCKNPNQPVILVGHSFGGDSVVEIAEKLKKKCIKVDLMVQIDSVGVGDEKKPDNVERGINIWSTSRKGVNGASNVEGSENIGLDGTTHTDIDSDPRTEKHIKDAIDKLKKGGNYANKNWRKKKKETKVETLR